MTFKLSDKIDNVGCVAAKDIKEFIRLETEIINDDYPDLEREEDRLIFLKWKENVLKGRDKLSGFSDIIEKEVRKK